MTDDAATRANGIDEPQMQAKRPVSALLAGPYGHPFHPILVTVSPWTSPH
jgi:hypothetical protein